MSAMRALALPALLAAALLMALAGCHRSEDERPGDIVPPAASTAVPSPAPPGPPDPSVLEIRDGSDFVVTVPARAHPCVLFPASLFDPAKCPAGAQPAPSPPGGLPGKVRLLAVAALEGDLPGGAPVQLTVSLNRMEHSYQPVPATANAFARGAVDSVLRSQTGASVRGGAPTVQLLTTHGLPVAKVTYDLEGTTTGGARLAHASIYAVWVPGGMYVVSLNAPPESAAYAAALADEMAATLRVAQLAPPAPAGVF